jgi:hypothetical protein
MKKSIYKNMPIEIPSTPDFIKVGEAMCSISTFTEDELQNIGKMWTINLIEKARQINTN